LPKHGLSLGIQEAKCSDGRTIRTIPQPPEDGESSSNLPLCVLMIFWLTVSPSPRPTALVVKKGEGALSATSGLNPGPLSCTWISRPGPVPLDSLRRRTETFGSVGFA